MNERDMIAILIGYLRGVCTNGQYVASLNIEKTMEIIKMAEKFLDSKSAV